MSRISGLFLLILLSLPFHAFSQEEYPQHVLLSEVLGPLEATEFIELTPTDLDHIHMGFRHSINSKMVSFSFMDLWEPLPQSQAVLDLLKTKREEFGMLVNRSAKETSAQFIERLLRMHAVAEEMASLFSSISKMQLPSEYQEDVARIRHGTVHILNLLDFSLRVFQKQKTSLSIKTLENVEALVELAKGESIYTHVNYQGEVMPSEVVSHLNLFMPREEFMARMTLFFLLADFVSDPNNQFRKPKISIQDGKLIMNLSYCLTLFGHAAGTEPWERGGPRLVTYLFKLFYERHLGASMATTQDFHNKLLEIEVRVPLLKPMEQHASLAGALSRLEEKMYLRRPGSLAQDYIFLDTTAHKIADQLSRFKGEIPPEVLRRTVTEVLERQIREPERAIDMDLLVNHLSRWGRQEEMPWSLKNVSFVARHLQESILKEAKRTVK